MPQSIDELISRRSLLRRGSCAALGLSGLASQLFTTRMVHAALAGQRFSDYKAMVCVFLYGGNDNGNTLIPYDGGAQDYSTYAALRSSLAIPQNNLTNTIINPTNTAGRRFALHPALTGVRSIFEQGAGAIVANVGTLVEPITKSQFVNGTRRTPPQLFSHNHQQEQWEISTADASEKIGWGGRVADALYAAGANPNGAVSMNVSIAGMNVFQSGRETTPYVISPWGPAALTTWGLCDWDEHDVVRQAFVDLLALQDNPNYAGRHLLHKAYSDVTRRAHANAQIVQTLLERPTLVPNPPPDNWLAEQLKMVARLIEYAQLDLRHERQVFFVGVGGYDTHDGVVGPNGELGAHGSLLASLDAGLLYFWNALGAIGMRDKVTTFTASDFGRTLTSNGNGSDHGWGGHHLVLGGSQVLGRKIYGQFPDLTVDGPQDTGSGRYIPTTSVDAFAFEFARWMGVPLSEMPLVFPNLNRFLDAQNPSTHLGFLA